MLGDSTFGKAVVRMTVGSMGIQLIGIAASPLTARIFSPAETGSGMLFGNMVTILGSVACLRYELALPLPAERSGRLDVFALGIALQLPLFLILTLLVCLFRSHIAVALGDPGCSSYLALLPLGVFVYAIQQLLLQWRIREREFDHIVKSRIYQSVGQIGFQLGSGSLVAGSAWVLVTGSILGNSILLVRLLQGFWNECIDHVKSVRWRRIWEIAGTYRRFPIFNSWSALADTLTPSIPSFALSMLHSTSETGYFRMAQMLVVLPIAAISSAVTNVYWGEAGRLVASNPEELLRLYKKMTKRLGWFAVALIATSFVMPTLVPLIFGIRWKEAGHYAMILAWPSSLALLCVVANNVSLVGKNHWEAIWIGARISGVLLALWFCKHYHASARTTLGAIAVVMCIGYVALIWINILALKAFIKSGGPKS